MPLPPGFPPDAPRLAIKAWNVMGGLDGSLLPVVAEMLGVDDIETLVVQLAAIRDWQRENPPETD